jgi:uncharacterized protein (TIGR02466 family)
MNVLHLFPVVVGHFEYTESLTKEIAYIKKCKFLPNIANLQSENTYILSEKPLSRIKSFCQNSLDEYVNNVIRPYNDLKCKITQSWLNLTERGQSHHVHAHPNSYLSAVFYFDTNEDDKIVFYDSTYRTLNLPSKTNDVHNSLATPVPAKNGTLYIFPSSTVHGVDPVNGDKQRISLSFNSFVEGKIGFGLYELNIKVL